MGRSRILSPCPAGAKMVVETFHGELPRSVNELKTIPGIGPYTTGAISSIAFGECAALVDGNVIRVLSRYRALPLPIGTALDKLCWKIATDLVDPEHPGTFNQGKLG